jgi:hypothetical protein
LVGSVLSVFTEYILHFHDFFFFYYYRVQNDCRNEKAFHRKKTCHLKAKLKGHISSNMIVLFCFKVTRLA